MKPFSAASVVKAQYEALPYPERDPQDESKRLVRTWLEDLPKINDYCFSGKNSFTDGFRALVAGGGTGDATIFLAWQLRHTDAKVVHLDVSLASIDIAKQRAALRGLSNIEWINESILEIPRLGLGRFDYINCAGVLHHLDDPDAGLVALSAALKPDGAIGIMVYGKIGRTGVYQMQELMRSINGDSTSHQEKLANAKAMLGYLPPTNWFVRGADLYSDHRSGDAGIYDLLLHSTDHAYTVPDLFDWLEDKHQFHLHFTDVYTGRAAYLPKIILGSAPQEVVDRVTRLPLRQQYAIAELMSGRITTHSFYLTKSSACKAPYGDKEYVPMYFHEPVTGPMMEKLFNTNRNKGKTFILQHQQAGVSFPVRPGKYGARILREIDGTKTFEEIFEIVRQDINYRTDRPSDEVLFSDFFDSFNALNSLDRLLLRHRDCKPMGTD